MIKCGVRETQRFTRTAVQYVHSPEALHPPARKNPVNFVHTSDGREATLVRSTACAHQLGPGDQAALTPAPPACASIHIETCRLPQDIFIQTIVEVAGRRFHLVSSPANRRLVRHLSVFIRDMCAIQTVAQPVQNRALPKTPAQTDN